MATWCGRMTELQDRVNLMVWNASPNNLVSQPTLRREGNARAHGCVFHGRKMHEVATNVYSRKTSEKPEKVWSTNLSVKGSGVAFMHRKGISTPRVRHKGQQPLVKCANMTSICFIFPFLCFYVFLCLLYFFIFLWSTRVFPSLLCILNCDEEIRPTQFFKN